MFATHVFQKPRRCIALAVVLSCTVLLQDRFRRKRENLLPAHQNGSQHLMIVGSGATVFFAAVLTVHLVR